MASSVSGGGKFGRALDAISGKLGNASEVQVGFLEGQTYPDGTSVPMVAAINEFGAPSRNQPPRPFFRRMIAEKSSSWPKAIADRLKANEFDARATLEEVGQGVASQLQDSIDKLVSPPLAPSTIARKGFDKPLIDTGQMRNSVSHIVKE